MKKWIAIALCIVALVGAGAFYTVSASNAEAARWENALFGQDEAAPGHGHGRVVGYILAHVARELNLSEQQKTEIKAIFTAERPVVAPLLKQLFDNHQEMRAATAQGRFDEAQVRAIATRQAQLVTELIVAKERVKSKVYQVLTPEQRAKAEQLHDRLAARLRQHFGG